MKNALFDTFLSALRCRPARPTAFRSPGLYLWPFFVGIWLGSVEAGGIGRSLGVYLIYVGERKQRKILIYMHVCRGIRMNDLSVRAV